MTFKISHSEFDSFLCEKIKVDSEKIRKRLFTIDN